MSSGPTPFKIGDYDLVSQPPLIIAEFSGNHNQDISLAMQMLEEAANAGVHAIKLQTYTADSMTLDVTAKGFVIEEEESLWHGESLYNLYQKAATPYDWHSKIFERAKELGLLAFSSPFDQNAVDFLDGLGVPCFKIASFELTDLPLIKAAASKGKPLIMSTGMATEQEIHEAVQTANAAGCEDLILLKCTSTYPASPANTNLLTIPDIKSRFQCLVGLSDHTTGIGAAVASIALGACVIEKHFVLDRTAGGVDAAFSLEPQEFKLLVEESKRAWEAIGEVKYGGSQAEEDSKQYRRSIYVSKSVKEGDIFGPDNLKIVRPAFGLPPKYWEEIQGLTASTNLEPGTALKWEHIKKT